MAVHASQIRVEIPNREWPISPKRSKKCVSTLSSSRVSVNCRGNNRRLRNIHM